MNCRELAEFILSYLDGELPEDERAAFELHLSRCRGCGCYLRQYRAAVEAGRRAFDCDRGVLPDVPEELIQAILDSRRRRTE